MNKLAVWEVSSKIHLITRIHQLYSFLGDVHLHENFSVGVNFSLKYHVKLLHR